MLAGNNMRRILIVATLTLIPLVGAQVPEAAPGRQQAPSANQTPAQPALERLGENLYRVGTIRVDTARKEISVPGTVNRDVTTLEFIANTRGGAKAYEAAITLDTDAFNFNAALILIGLNKSRARNVPTAHFDPATPDGDEVEIFVECAARECPRIPADRLMLDKATNTAASGGKWIYTGSAFLPDGRFLAQLDGVLVGFVHSPATIVEYAAGAGLNKYGSIVLNPNSGLAPGTAVVMTLRMVRQAVAP
jgi:hypothetical protein